MGVGLLYMSVVRKFHLGKFHRENSIYEKFPQWNTSMHALHASIHALHGFIVDSTFSSNQLAIFYVCACLPNWEKLHPLFERLSSLGIMGAQLRDSFKRLNTIVL